MTKNRVNRLLAEFADKESLYDNYSNALKYLIDRLLETKGIYVHSVDTRVKDYYSFKKKIEDRNKYTSIKDVTDIVGVRIITYFEDDVDKVAEIFKDEFNIDWHNSIDKREKTNPDTFGYASLHYIVNLPEERLELVEYQEFNSLKAEVQIRSILQHAWAEIEHDLGYKSKIEAPFEIRRDFSRVASLLETADKEFKNIRINLERLESKINEEMEQNNFEIDVNKASLKSYIAKSALVETLDEKIAEVGGTGIEFPNDSYLNSLLEELNHLGITNVNSLNELLAENQSNIIHIAQQLFEEEENDYEKYLHRGISIYYLGYVLVSTESNIDKIKSYLSANNIEFGARREKLARKLFEASQSLSS
ncbi:GTP pyrophosphokinase [Halobacillus salinus]|uniref:(P)ppGpp synthetase n=1 Tax=Halobacillus salinus TaxID=192814 RepID=A0A4Z0H436_9BACI|nr:(p)ppGpp synthetase [Halobacillus salinus]TGB05182.1 (p)ppGpp synthetase [Halobacillus salinus]